MFRASVSPNADLDQRIVPSALVGLEGPFWVPQVESVDRLESIAGPEPQLVEQGSDARPDVKIAISGRSDGGTAEVVRGQRRFHRVAIQDPHVARAVEDEGPFAAPRPVGAVVVAPVERTVHRLLIDGDRERIERRGRGHPHREQTPSPPTVGQRRARDGAGTDESHGGHQSGRTGHRQPEEERPRTRFVGGVRSFSAEGRRWLGEGLAGHLRQLSLEVVLFAAHRVELLAQRTAPSSHGRQLIGQSGRPPSIRRVAIEQLGAPLPIPVGIDSVRHGKHQPTPVRVHSAGQGRRRRRQSGKAAPKSSHQGPDERAPTTSQPHP